VLTSFRSPRPVTHTPSSPEDADVDLVPHTADGVGQGQQAVHKVTQGVSNLQHRTAAQHSTARHVNAYAQHIRAYCTAHILCKAGVCCASIVPCASPHQTTRVLLHRRAAAAGPRYQVWHGPQGNLERQQQGETDQDSRAANPAQEVA
jgi:hypothetical protein